MGRSFLLLWPLRRLRRHLPITWGGVVQPHPHYMGRSFSTALAPPAPSAPPPHFMGRSCPATSSLHGRSFSAALAPPAPSAPPPHFMGRSCPPTSSPTWGGGFLLRLPLPRLRRHLPLSWGAAVPP